MHFAASKLVGHASVAVGGKLFQNNLDLGPVFGHQPGPFPGLLPVRPLVVGAPRELHEAASPATDADSEGPEIIDGSPFGGGVR